jgi:hypothetical protein
MFKELKAAAIIEMHGVMRQHMVLTALKGLSVPSDISALTTSRRLGVVRNNDIGTVSLQVGRENCIH